ncbi:MAG: histidine triad nucleotide-binding protein [Oscillospiraceae bacterium]|jgi:histidine triad (HIT) family protein|nr:histidine triad nucleotide-binding protein [Oscillospiraceae bacterium]
MCACIFCGIGEKKIPAKILYENNQVIAFHDLNPVAPVHFLVIPKNHIASVKDINENNSHIVAKLFEVIAELAKKEKLEAGFRVTTNSGKLAGQTVDHLHFHVLGKRTFNWPPG